MTIRYTLIESRLGEMLAVASDTGLRGLYYIGQKYQPAIEALQRDGAVRDDDWPLLVEVREQIAEYERAQRKRFTVPLDLGGTEFQRKVWQTLSEIPFGSTCSYAELARRCGSPQAVRAVGAAIGRNPVLVIVPCHRAIGSDGSLTGYAGGLPRKRSLLSLEGIV